MANYFEYDRLFAVLKDAHNAAADEEHQTNEMPHEFRDIIIKTHPGIVANMDIERRQWER